MNHQEHHCMLTWYRFIELNPVRAELVRDSADYVWSNYQSNVFGQSTQMWAPHKEYLALGNTRRLRLKAYQHLFLREMGSELIANIRNPLNTGLVLGNDRFREEVEQLTGQPQKHSKRGPKKASAWSNNGNSFYTDPKYSVPPIMVRSRLFLEWNLDQLKFRRNKTIGSGTISRQWTESVSGNIQALAVKGRLIQVVYCITHFEK